MGGSYSRHDKGVKASFDHIYDLEDPRGYFNTLGELNYQAPRHGSSIFSTLLGEMDLNGDPAKILDLCCSYGVNAALLKHEITLEDLYDRYGSKDLVNLSTEELAAADAEFYEDHRSESPPEVVGVDVAENAVSYAVQTGLLDAGFAENLEDKEPSDGLKEAVSGADLLTVTGGIGYVWQNTFDRVLSCFDEDEKPWVATMPLRMVDYTPVAETLSCHGLSTEKLTTRTFQQRRFLDDREREHVLQKLTDIDVDPNGKEASGWFHSEFYLSRPSEEAEKLPLKELPGISATA